MSELIGYLQVNEEEENGHIFEIVDDRKLGTSAVSIRLSQADSVVPASFLLRPLPSHLPPYRMRLVDEMAVQYR